VVGTGNTAIRKTLVVAQVSLLLLIGAALFAKSLRNLSTVDPGFPVDRLLGFEVDPSLNGYKTEQTRAFYQRLTESLEPCPACSRSVWRS